MKRSVIDSLAGIIIVILFLGCGGALIHAVGPDGWFPLEKWAFPTCFVLALAGLLSSGLLFSNLRQNDWPLPPWSTAFFVIAIACLLAFLPMWINGKFDRHSPRNRRASVMGQVNGPLFFKYLKVNSWKRPGQVLLIPATEKELRDFPFGSDIVISTGPGLIRCEWVRGIKPVH